jgi:hypothetical protein
MSKPRRRIVRTSLFQDATNPIEFQFGIRARRSNRLTREAYPDNTRHAEGNAPQFRQSAGSFGFRLRKGPRPIRIAAVA